MPIFRTKNYIHTASGIVALGKRLHSTPVESGHVVYMDRLDSEDGGIRLPRNLDNYLPVSTATSYTRGL